MTITTYSFVVVHTGLNGQRLLMKESDGYLRLPTFSRDKITKNSDLEHIRMLSKVRRNPAKFFLKKAGIDTSFVKSVRLTLMKNIQVVTINLSYVPQKMTLGYHFIKPTKQLSRGSYVLKETHPTFKPQHLTINDRDVYVRKIIIKRCLQT